MLKYVGNINLLGQTFHATSPSPVDDRLVVDRFYDLTNNSYWDNNGSYIYVGMPVAVVSDTVEERNGLYLCIETGADFKASSSKWQKVSSQIKLADLLLFLTSLNVEIKEWFNQLYDDSSINNGDTLTLALKKLDDKIQELFKTKYDADEDDLTINKVSGVIQFNSYLPNAAKFHSYGRIILRPDNLKLLGTKSVLDQTAFPSANTIYEIKYDFDLENRTITIPSNCVLFFNGGMLTNGTIQGSNTYVYGTFTPINVVNNIGLNAYGYSSLYTKFKDCYNFDGTSVNSATIGASNLRPSSEIGGFTYYDVELKKLIVWDSNVKAWKDTFGNAIIAEHFGSSPKAQEEHITPTFLYKDKSEYWKSLSSSDASRWLIRNDAGGWDALASTDIVTTTLDGLMSKEDKIWLEGDEGHPENGAKERINDLEALLKAIREDFLVSNTFLDNSAFTNLLDHWETQNVREELISCEIVNLKLNSIIVPYEKKDKYSSVIGWEIPKELIKDYESYINNVSYKQVLTSELLNEIMKYNSIRPDASIKISKTAGEIWNELTTDIYNYKGEVIYDSESEKYVINVDDDKYDGIEIPDELITDEFLTGETYMYNFTKEQIASIFNNDYVSDSVKCKMYNEVIPKYFDLITGYDKDGEPIITQIKIGIEKIIHHIEFTLVTGIKHNILFTITRGAKRFLTFGKKTNTAFGKYYGNFIQCSSDSYLSLLSDHRGYSYAITKEARSTVCIHNNFIRQNSKYYVNPPKMERSSNGLYIPIACDLSFYYYVELPGTLKIEFEDESKDNDDIPNNLIKSYNRLQIEEHWPKSDEWKKYNTNFLWNSKGNFKLSFTGKIYVHTIVTCFNASLLLKNDYSDLHNMSKTVTSRFNGFDTGFELTDDIIENTLNEYVEAEEVIYATNLKRFVGVYYRNNLPHYCNNWNSIDLFNLTSETGKDKIYQDKIYLYNDGIYIYNEETNNLEKYSSDNNDHLINVDQNGFYIVDQNGYIAFLVNNEGTKYAIDKQDNQDVETLKDTVSQLTEQIQILLQQIQALLN